MAGERLGRTTAAVLFAATIPTAVAYLTVLGLGMHRHAQAWAVAASTTALVFGPPLMAVAARPQGRLRRFGVMCLGWSLGLLAATPVYFPGERNPAFATGLALLGMGKLDSLAERIATALPEEPVVAKPELPEATALVTEVPAPPTQTLEPDQIALPYEGEGRRLSVPVVMGHAGDELETWMMLDTGATYTTLPMTVLERLGAEPADDAPVIELHTANGTRSAQVALIDQLWLGDLSIEGVAIATCDECASGDTVGLLGLNVTGGYNVTIDADRREVILTQRQFHDRRLDVRPFVDIDASLSRFPGGRTEVLIELSSLAPRAIETIEAGIHCGEQAWTVEITDIDVRGEATARRRLPHHEPCERYEVGVESATW